MPEDKPSTGDWASGDCIGLYRDTIGIIEVYLDFSYKRMIKGYFGVL